MGTNIYLVKEITQEDRDKLKEICLKAIDNFKTSTEAHATVGTIERAIYEYKDGIHICKRSAGWQLLFQSHKDLYDCNWKSMTDFIAKCLADGTYKMIDEYGRSYTLEDLKDDLEQSKDGYTGETYDEECLKTWASRYSSKKGEYISDNLRWTDNDFS